MAWKISWTTEAQHSLEKLDRQIARRIQAYFVERVALLDNPRTLGKPLRGPLREYWRYRIGDYRAVCEIQDQTVVIVVIFLDHRKDVYR